MKPCLVPKIFSIAVPRIPAHPAFLEKVTATVDLRHLALSFWTASTCEAE